MVMARLAHVPASQRAAQSGRAHVREHFLLPRLPVEELRLLSSLGSDGPVPPDGPLRET
jgi:hypothetical protein